MRLEDMSAEQLEERLEELEAKRQEIRAEALEVMKIRNAKLAETNKQARRDSAELLAMVPWDELRAKRDEQRATAGVAEVGVTAEK